MDKKMIAGRRYEGAVWHQYFNCPGKKEPMLSDVFEKKIRFYKLNYPFLQKKQIMAKVYEELKIPHYCGNPDKAKLHRMYLQSRKSQISLLEKSQTNINKRILRPDSRSVKMKQVADCLAMRPTKSNTFPCTNKPLNFQKSLGSSIGLAVTPKSLIPPKSVTFQEGEEVLNISSNFNTPTSVNTPQRKTLVQTPRNVIKTLSTESGEIKASVFRTPSQTGPQRDEQSVRRSDEEAGHKVTRVPVEKSRSDIYKKHSSSNDVTLQSNINLLTEPETSEFSASLQGNHETQEREKFPMTTELQANPSLNCSEPQSEETLSMTINEVVESPINKKNTSIGIKLNDDCNKKEFLNYFSLKKGSSESDINNNRICVTDSTNNSPCLNSTSIPKVIVQTSKKNVSATFNKENFKKKMDSIKNIGNSTKRQKTSRLIKNNSKKESFTDLNIVEKYNKIEGVQEIADSGSQENSVTGIHDNHADISENEILPVGSGITHSHENSSFRYTSVFRDAPVSTEELRQNEDNNVGCETSYHTEENTEQGTSMNPSDWSHGIKTTVESLKELLLSEVQELEPSIPIDYDENRKCFRDSIIAKCRDTDSDIVYSSDSDNEARHDSEHIVHKDLSFINKTLQCLNINRESSENGFEKSSLSSLTRGDCVSGESEKVNVSKELNQQSKLNLTKTSTALIRITSEETHNEKIEKNLSLCSEESEFPDFSSSETFGIAVKEKQESADKGHDVSTAYETDDETGLLKLNRTLTISALTRGSTNARQTNNEEDNKSTADKKDYINGIKDNSHNNQQDFNSDGIDFLSKIRRRPSSFSTEDEIIFNYCLKKKLNKYQSPERQMSQRLSEDEEEYINNKTSFLNAWLISTRAENDSNEKDSEVPNHQLGIPSNSSTHEPSVVTEQDEIKINLNYEKSDSSSLPITLNKSNINRIDIESGPNLSPLSSPTSPVYQSNSACKEDTIMLHNKERTKHTTDNFSKEFDHEQANQSEPLNIVEYTFGYEDNQYTIINKNENSEAKKIEISVEETHSSKQKSNTARIIRDPEVQHESLVYNVEPLNAGATGNKTSVSIIGNTDSSNNLDIGKQLFNLDKVNFRPKRKNINEDSSNNNNYKAVQIEAITGEDKHLCKKKSNVVRITGHSEFQISINTDDNISQYEHVSPKLFSSSSSPPNKDLYSSPEDVYLISSDEDSLRRNKRSAFRKKKAKFVKVKPIVKQELATSSSSEETLSTSKRQLQRRRRILGQLNLTNPGKNSSTVRQHMPTVKLFKPRKEDLINKPIGVRNENEIKPDVPGGNKKVSTNKLYFRSDSERALPPAIILQENSGSGVILKEKEMSENESSQNSLISLSGSSNTPSLVQNIQSDSHLQIKMQSIRNKSRILPNENSDISQEQSNETFKKYINEGDMDSTTLSKSYEGNKLVQNTSKKNDLPILWNKSTSMKQALESGRQTTSNSLSSPHDRSDLTKIQIDENRSAASISETYEQRTNITSDFFQPPSQHKRQPLKDLSNFEGKRLHNLNHLDNEKVNESNLVNRENMSYETNKLSKKRQPSPVSTSFLSFEEALHCNKNKKLRATSSPKNMTTNQTDSFSSNSKLEIPPQSDTKTSVVRWMATDTAASQSPRPSPEVEILMRRTFFMGKYLSTNQKQ